ncbi:MAG: hypothetical protein F6J87_30960, partial [Spirulina sp. SIO3F2]|nr:hypothetical protein [Spirulina sp. SIO3F2]
MRPVRWPDILKTIALCSHYLHRQLPPLPTMLKLRSRLLPLLKQYQRHWRRGFAFSCSLLLTLTLTSGFRPSIAQEIPLPLPPAVTVAAAEPVPPDPLDAGRFYHRQGRYSEALAAWEQASQAFER